MNGIKFLLSWAIVALGQPAWIPWLAPLAACMGYALFWNVSSGLSVGKRRVFLGFIWFSGIQFLQLSWMTSIEFTSPFILLAYGVLSFCLGIQFGFITFWVDRIPLLATTALWVILEWTRLYWFCGFSWNPVGLSLTAFCTSLQFASIFGILGLSFWVLITNLAFWRKKYLVATLLTLTPYLFGIANIAIQSPKIAQAASLKVGLIQTALLPFEKILIDRYAKKYVTATDQWKRIIRLAKKESDSLDLVVLPEYAVPYTDLYDGYFFSQMRDVFEEILGKTEANNLLTIDPLTVKVSNRVWIQMLSKMMKADVIAGGATKYEGSYFTSALFCPYETQEIKKYDKQILVPLAEYVPFAWVKKISSIFGINEFFSHGKESVIFSSKIPLSPSICYEETFGHVIRQGRVKGGELFVNLTNDNWYMNSRLPKQHFDHARLRAVENGVPMVRACNTGITAAMDSLGRILGQITDEYRADMLVVKVPLHSYKTLYSFWGNQGILYLCLGCLMICIYVNRHKLYNYKKN